MLMRLAKLVNLGFLKTKSFSNKDYEIVHSVHDVTNKILYVPQIKSLNFHVRSYLKSNFIRI